MRCRCGKELREFHLLCKACADKEPMRRCEECGGATKLTLCEECQLRLFGEVLIAEDLTAAGWVWQLAAEEEPEAVAEAANA